MEGWRLLPGMGQMSRDDHLYEEEHHFWSVQLPGLWRKFPESESGFDSLSRSSLASRNGKSLWVLGIMDEEKQKN